MSSTGVLDQYITLLKNPTAVSSVIVDGGKIEYYVVPVGDTAMLFNPSYEYVLFTANRDLQYVPPFTKISIKSIRDPVVVDLPDESKQYHVLKFAVTAEVYFKQTPFYDDEMFRETEIDGVFMQPMNVSIEDVQKVSSGIFSGLKIPEWAKRRSSTVVPVTDIGTSAKEPVTPTDVPEAPSSMGFLERTRGRFQQFKDARANKKVVTDQDLPSGDITPRTVSDSGISISGTVPGSPPEPRSPSSLTPIPEGELESEDEEEQDTFHDAEEPAVPEVVEEGAPEANQPGPVAVAEEPKKRGNILGSAFGKIGQGVKYMADGTFQNVRHVRKALSGLVPGKKQPVPPQAPDNPGDVVVGTAGGGFAKYVKYKHVLYRTKTSTKGVYIVVDGKRKYVHKFEDAKKKETSKSKSKGKEGKKSTKRLAKA